MQMWIDNNMISKNTKKINGQPYAIIYIYIIRIKYLFFFLKKLKYIYVNSD